MRLFTSRPLLGERDSAFSPASRRVFHRKSSAAACTLPRVRKTDSEMGQPRPSDIALPRDSQCQVYRRILRCAIVSIPILDLKRLIFELHTALALICRPHRVHRWQISWTAAHHQNCRTPVFAPSSMVKRPSSTRHCQLICLWPARELSEKRKHPPQRQVGV